MCASLSLCVGTSSEVPVESGLDEEKALEILALYVNGKPQKLPEQARSIVSECKGTNHSLCKTEPEPRNMIKRDPAPKDSILNSNRVKVLNTMVIVMKYH